MYGIPTLSEKDFQEVGARLARVYGLKKEDDQVVFLEMSNHAMKNRTEVAPLIGVTPDVLVAFGGEVVRRVTR